MGTTGVFLPSTFFASSETSSPTFFASVPAASPAFFAPASAFFASVLAAEPATLASLAAPLPTFSPSVPTASPAFVAPASAFFASVLAAAPATLASLAAPLPTFSPSVPTASPAFFAPASAFFASVLAAAPAFFASFDLLRASALLGLLRVLRDVLADLLALGADGVPRLLGVALQLLELGLLLRRLRRRVLRGTDRRQRHEGSETRHQNPAFHAKPLLKSIVFVSSKLEL